MKPSFWLYGLLTVIVFSCKEEPKIQDSLVTNSTSPNLERIINDYKQCWNNNQPESFECLLAEDFKRFSNGKLEATNYEELTALVNSLHDYIPDFHTEVKDLVIQDNKAFYRWECTGSFNENGTTNLKKTINGFAVITFSEDGLIHRHENFYDSLEAFLRLKTPTKGEVVLH